MRFPHRSILLLAAVAATTPYTPLRAQARPDTLRPVVLDSLIVTVLRTPIELARAPYAVSVNTMAETQRARPGLGVDEALRGVPGVQVDNRYNYALGERISVRGFGARAQFGVRGIRVLVDGIPATFPDGQTSLSHVDLGLVGRVEVLRGPAAALYGSTAGGVIQMETEPSPARPIMQEVGVTGGSNGLLRLQSTTAGQRGRTSYLVGLSRLEFDGYRDFSSATNNRFNARLGWAGDRSSLRLVASAVEYDAQNPGSLTQALLQADRNQAFANNKLQQTGESAQQGQLGATWRHAAGGGEWEVTGYGTARRVENPIPTIIVALDRAVGGFRALRRAGTGAVRWAAGVETDVQMDDRQNYGNARGTRAVLRLDQQERVTNAGVFGELVLTPLDRLTVVGGTRYDWFRFRVEDRLVTENNPDDSGQRDMDAVSPSLGASWALAEAVNLYANLATAFETPTTTELANRPSGAGGFNPELEPQRTLSLEAGAKGAAGRLVTYELALYRARVRNALIPFEVPSAPGRQFFRNAGTTVHRGVEAGLVLLRDLGPWLRASYTYTDARFDQFGTVGGKRVPGVAPHRAELITTYAHPRGWFATAETRHASSTPVRDDNTAHSPAYTVTDLRAGVQSLRVGRARLEPFLGVGNVFDVQYNTSVVVNAFGGRFFEPGPGRNLYVGVTAGI